MSKVLHFPKQERELPNRKLINCLDCRNSEKHGYNMRCVATGRYCDMERFGGNKSISDCGPDALLFEPKLGLFTRIHRFFFQGGDDE